MVSTLKMSMGEIVLSVMALASKKGGVKKFPYPSVFAAFQKLTEEYPDYFPGLHFHYLAGGVPHSRRLENILFRLGTWEGISIENPRFHYLQVSKEVVADVEEDIRTRYGEPVLHQLEELGEKFIASVPREEYETVDL